VEGSPHLSQTQALLRRSNSLRENEIGDVIDAVAAFQSEIRDVQDSVTAVQKDIGEILQLLKRKQPDEDQKEEDSHINSIESIVENPSTQSEGTNNSQSIPVSESESDPNKQSSSKKRGRIKRTNQTPQTNESQEAQRMFFYPY